jgi:hypothetical protein
MKVLALIFTLGILCGCSSVPLSSKESDSEAKEFVPAPNKANIYIFRSGYLGGSLLFQTIIDGKNVGGLAPETYQFVSVAPGEHVIAVTSQENEQQVKIEAEQGKDYFFKVSPHTIGLLFWAVGIEPVTEKEGREQVMGAKRAETDYP